MKNKLLGIIMLSGITLLSLLFYSSSNNPPNGKTGAPGEGTCADCHSAAAGAYNGSLFIEGIPPAIIGGATYQVTVTVSYSAGLPVRTGFQMVCLNASNSNAGVFSNPSPATTITSSGGRVYFEHNAVQTWGGNTMKSWTVDWTAPNGPNGDVISFYAASVIANGNSGTSGDDVLTTSTMTILNVAVDPLELTLANSEGVSCFGASDGSAEVNVTGGEPPYSYLWSNGETGNPASSLPGGINSITVTDIAGTMESLDVFIEEPAPLVINSAEITNSTCPESADGAIAIQVSGGTMPYSYSWSNGASTKDISELEPGSYAVTIIDANACMTDDNYVINSENPSPEVSIIISGNLCPGSTIVLSTDGFFDLYEWSTGEFTPEITIDEPGFYSVTVHDFNGCSAFTSVIIIEQVSPVANIFEKENNFCQQEGNAVLRSLNEGFSYNWSTGDSEREITVAESGLYSLTVTNEFGCTDTDSYTFNIPADLVSDPIILSQISCFGENDASVLLSAEGGQGIIGFTWRELPQGQPVSYGNMDTISNIGSGQYELVCYDSINCSVIDTLIFDEPGLLITGLSFQNESVPGAADGSAMVDPGGGTAPYQFLWSTGSTEQQITGLTQGNYSVTVIDGNNCEAIENFFVSTGECDLSASYEVNNPSCFGFNDGYITIYPVNAEEPVEYSWSVDVTSPSPVLGDLSEGVYSVTITDNRNCTFVITGIVVTEPEELLLQLEITHETLKDANDGTASAVVSGGMPPYAYLWSNGETTMGLVDLAPGDYSVTITDENACLISDIFTIEASNISSIYDADIDKAIEVYPNPNAGKIFVEAENIADYDVIISDILGKKTRLELKGGAIDLSRFGNGNYLLIFNNRHHNTRVIKRIVISK